MRGRTRYAKVLRPRNWENEKVDVFRLLRITWRTYKTTISPDKLFVTFVQPVYQITEHGFAIHHPHPRSTLGHVVPYIYLP